MNKITAPETIETTPEKGLEIKEKRSLIENVLENNETDPKSSFLEKWQTEGLSVKERELMLNIFLDNPRVAEYVQQIYEFYGKGGSVPSIQMYQKALRDLSRFKRRSNTKTENNPAEQELKIKNLTPRL